MMQLRYRSAGFGMEAPRVSERESVSKLEESEPTVYEPLRRHRVRHYEGEKSRTGEATELHQKRMQHCTAFHLSDLPDLPARHTKGARFMSPTQVRMV
jgi:hypothetical protein